MKISVTTASGVEAVTKRELYKLGVEDAPAINGRMTFEGDIKTLVDCNMYLSTASRVYVNLLEFKCPDFNVLYDGVFSIDWKNYVSERGRIVVEPKLVDSKIIAFSATQSVVKKAICEKLKKQYKTDYLPENGETYTVEIAITHDFCAVLLNSSGESLHKRGYRKLYGEAQLKETLASAMIELSVWKEDRPFVDLFTGTGTIAIEGAMKAKNMAPGLRRTFDFLKFTSFDKSVYDKVKSEAISRISPKKPITIQAYDIDEKQLSLASFHARRAHVDDAIEFKLENMSSFKSNEKRGVAFANPPYGERLEERREIENLYKTMGRVSRNNPDWCFYTITPVSDFERLFGAKADKKRKLYNGRIACTYYSHLAKLPKN